MQPSSGIARLAFGAVLLIVVLGVATCSGTRPSAQPTATPFPTTNASADLLQRTEDQGFALTFQVGRDRYRAGEPIDAFATLTYLGPNDRENAVGSSSGVVLFSVEEVGGLRHADWIATADCAPHIYERNVTQTISWKKSGGYSPDDPNAAFTRAYLDGPELILPSGTWTLRAGGYFVIGECGGPSPDLGTAITIVVDP